jgi:hypothetical protein
MGQAELTAMRKRLDDFSKRLQADIEAFRRLGEFLDMRKASLGQLRQRHDLLMEKVAEAAREGDTGKLIETSLKRDVDALFDNLHQFNEQLDAETMLQLRSKQGLKS